MNIESKGITGAQRVREIGISMCTNASSLVYFYQYSNGLQAFDKGKQPEVILICLKCLVSVDKIIGPGCRQYLL